MVVAHRAAARQMMSRSGFMGNLQTLWNGPILRTQCGTCRGRFEENSGEIRENRKKV
jgi:hypothetical protein